MSLVVRKSCLAETDQSWMREICVKSSIEDGEMRLRFK